MGKPFAKELDLIEGTLEWAFNQDIDELKISLLEDDAPIYIVGSGGSLSACHFASLLLQQFGIMSKAITPLEIQYIGHSFGKANILFLSASGRNTDILFGLESSLKFEPIKIITICTKLGTPLTQLCSRSSIGYPYEYDLPTGKDGFLATNSLVAFFIILVRCFSPANQIALSRFCIDPNFVNDLEKFINKVTSDYTFVVLYGGWGQPVAIDIESKMAEAALGDVLITDYRNFGHGRHHWFHKRGANSAIIAIVSPREKELADKTLSLLPTNIPILNITSELDSGIASIELLIKSFSFIKSLGKMQGIDPGKPGVPDFGRKMYHLNYQRYYITNEEKPLIQKKVSISRKANVASFDNLDIEDKKYWSDCYDLFIQKIESVEFGGLIFDYDGTLCSSKNRFIGIDEMLEPLLNDILDRGIIIGIATGRGKSVKEALKRSIKKDFWKHVIIGYYNGSEIGLLDDDDVPFKSQSINSKLHQLYNSLNEYRFVKPIKPEIRPNQLTIEVTDRINWNKVRPAIIQTIIDLNLPNIQILESSHSMDIVDQSVSNKLHVISHCVALANQENISAECLCIGDRGKWPGNDYQLLSTPHSLSVDETSSLHDSCWNIALPGVKNIEATCYYLSCLSFTDRGVKFHLS